MGDDLTVRNATRTSGAGASADVAAAESAAKKAGSDSDAKVGRMRELILQRHGKLLPDASVQKILARLEAKAERVADLSESKTAFAAELHKESVGLKAESTEVKAQKTTGAEGARGKDGLSEHDRTLVRSDPNAGPKLPPAEGKAATAAQAHEFVTQVLGNALLGEQPLDLARYADSLKPKAPTQPRDATGTRAAMTGGRPQAALANAGRGLTHAAAAQTASGTRPNPSGTPAQPQGAAPGTRGTRATGTTTLPGQAPSTTRATLAPTPALMPQLGSASGIGRPGASGPAFGSPGATLSLSMRGTRSASGSAASAPASNAGGGFTTETSFDGMHFNWSAFLAKFIIETEEDLAKWKRAMREVRRLAGKNALLSKEVQMAVTKMIQDFEKLSAGVNASSAVADAAKRVQDARVNSLAGKAPEKLGSDLDTLAKTLAENGGDKLKLGKRLVPTKAEIDRAVAAKELTDDQATKIRAASSSLRDDVGPMSFAALLNRDKASIKGTGAGEELLRQDYAREVAAANDDVQAVLKGGTTNPGYLKLLDQRRRLMVSINGDKKSKPEVPAAKDERRTVLLETLFEFDTQMQGLIPSSEKVKSKLAETLAAIPADIKEAKQPPDDPVKFAAWWKNEQLKYLTAGPNTGAEPPRKRIDDLYATNPNERNKALEGAAEAGTEYVEAQDEEIGPMRLWGFKPGEIVSAGAAMAKQLGDRFEADSGGFKEAVNQAVGGVVGQTQQYRRELDAQYEQRKAETQGLINQLVMLMSLGA